MHIGLVQVDGKIPNMALMQIAHWHESRYDTVEWFNGMLFADQYDKVYASKIFDFSEMPQLPENSIIGGTGIDHYNRLPDEIATKTASYSLYPNWTSHVGFTMKGCRFNCSFCVVPKKEGKPQDYNHIDNLLCNPNGGNRLMLLDNDFFGGKNWEMHLKRIIELNLKVCFAQGLNIRIITHEQAKLLSQVNYRLTNFKDKLVTFAWDRMRDEKNIIDKIEMCVDAGIPAKHMQFYVLIGYDTTPEQDYHRIMTLKGLECLPFVMPYDKEDEYQRRFARWVNHRAIFKTVKWENYNR